MSLLVKSNQRGRTMVALEDGRLEYVGFAAYRLSLGETLPVSAGDRELCLVLLSGRVTIQATASTGRTSAIVNRCSRTNPRSPPTRHRAPTPRSRP
jgi:5-deoxy-D-glucuronate isomerase